MSINRLKVVISAFVVLLSACQLKFNESVPEATVVEIKSSQCLKQAKVNAKIFFDGDASSEQTDYFINCFSNVLQSFKDNVNGSREDGYTQDELKQIIDNSFLKDGEQISIDFIDQIFKFKKALVGGEVNFLTKAEVEQVSKILFNLKSEFIQIAPYVKVIKHDWDISELSFDEKNIKFNQASAVTLNAINAVGQYLSLSDGAYKITDFIELLRQGAIFSETEQSNIDNIEKSKEIVKALKMGFIGGQDEVLTYQWSSVASMLHQVLFKYLYFKYYSSDVKDIQLEEQTNVLLELAQSTLVYFSNLLLERPDRQYLSESEVHNVMSSLVHFVSSYNISNDFSLDVLNIKNALVNSESQNAKIFSAHDFVHISQKISLIKKNILSSVLNLEALNSPLSYEDFNKIESQFIFDFVTIAQQIEGPYSLFSAQRFVKEIAQSKMIDSFSLPEKFDSWYQLVLSVKYLIFGQQGAGLTANELQKFLTHAARFFMHYKEYDLFWSKVDYYSKEFSSLSFSFINKIESHLTSIIQNKNSKSFTRLELQSLFLSAKSTFFEDLKLSVQGFDLVLNSVFENILISPENRLAGKTLTGLNVESVQILSSEIKNLLQSHQVVFSILPTLNDILMTDYQKILADKQNESDLNGFEIVALQELVRVSNSGLPYHFNSLNYVRILEENQYFINAQDLFKSILAKSFSRLLIRSFSHDLERIRLLTGVTLGEAQIAFRKLRPALVEMELIQESNLTFIESRFRESSLFVASANGDAFASLEEIHDITLHIYSGIGRADKIQEQVVQSCLPDLLSEVKPETTVAQDCLLEQYFLINQGYEGLPKFLDLKKSAAKELNINFYLSMLKAAGHIPNEQKTVQFADADLFPHVIQYIEVIFSRFDINRDGILDNLEAKTAFPVFKETIKSVLFTIKNGDKIPDHQIIGVFMYLLKYKKTPVTPKDYFQLLTYLEKPEKWDVKSNRFDLGDIFNFIADATAPKPPVSGTAIISTAGIL